MRKQIVKKIGSQRQKKALCSRSMRSLLNYAEGELGLKGNELAEKLDIRLTQQYYAMKDKKLSKRLQLLVKLKKLGLSWDDIGRKLEQDYE